MCGEPWVTVMLVSTYWEEAYTGEDVDVFCAALSADPFDLVVCLREMALYPKGLL